ncbi:MAG TPA: G1 family glutamic endopeptidase [Streptosporangiaceae bacterium]
MGMSAPGSSPRIRGGRLARRLAVTASAAAMLALGAAVPASAGTVATSDLYGYGVITGTHTSSGASWTMPSVHCGAATTYESMWTGLDGYSSDSIEQVGTDADCVGGTAAYDGWYELYPAAPVYFSNAIAAGDHLTASVTYSGTNQFTIVLQDTTKGWSHTVAKALSGVKRSSAETVLELPDGYTCVTPVTLAAFTGVTVDGAAISTKSPAKWQGSDPSIMVSPLTGTSTAGSSFTVSCT